jgi:hypothetical protein
MQDRKHGSTLQKIAEEVNLHLSVVVRQYYKALDALKEHFGSDEIS